MNYPPIIGDHKETTYLLNKWFLYGLFSVNSYQKPVKHLSLIISINSLALSDKY